jgi:hypothetical protein
MLNFTELVGVKILKYIGSQRKITLMTNNPENFDPIFFANNPIKIHQYMSEKLSFVVLQVDGSVTDSKNLNG